MRCKTCRFSADNPFHCRRSPPVYNSPTSVSFPVVTPEFWCGEYRLSLLKLVRSLRRKPSQPLPTATEN